ncbi:MAG: heme ABC exporter ATP-binding protein CcmA [Sphingorhabdus sp.]
MADRQATPASITLENIAVVRGGRLVLQKFSLQVRAGDIIWLRGANGTGKSTLLRLIAGLLPAAAGDRQIDGKIALVDDRLALDSALSVEKALGYWARMDGSSAQAQQDALAAFDLANLADIPVGYLSSGQRKRAALARVLASNADVWLLDEPYNGLDSANAARLDGQLLKHAQSAGIAIVAAHQPASINVAATISLDEQRVNQTG